jgi:hypothetical protein
LKKAISNSKIALVSNELQEAFNYFRQSKKNLYMAVKTLDNCGIRQHIKPTNI